MTYLLQHEAVYNPFWCKIWYDIEAMNMPSTSVPATKTSPGNTRLISLIGGILIVLGLVLLAERLQIVMQAPSDFVQDYSAAQALRVGLSIYEGTGDNAVRPEDYPDQVLFAPPARFQNYHPPFNALLFVPFTFVPYAGSILIWSALSLVLYFGIGYLVLRELQISLPRHWLILLIGLMLCWYPFQMHIALGQVSMILIACLIIGWVLLRHNRPLLAGGMIGLACLIKLFPGLIIFYMIVRRKWYAAGAAIATLLVGGGVTVLLVGIDDLLYYVQQIAPENVAVHGPFLTNSALNGTIRRLFSDGRWVRPIVAAPQIAMMLYLLVSLMLVGFLTYRLWRLPTTQRGEDSAFGLTCLVMLLMSPITWQHVFPLLFLPLGLILKVLMEHRQTDRWLIGMGLLILVLISLPELEIARIVMGWFLPYRMPWCAALLLIAPTIGLLLLTWVLSLRSITHVDEGQSVAT